MRRLYTNSKIKQSGEETSSRQKECSPTEKQLDESEEGLEKSVLE